MGIPAAICLCSPLVPDRPIGLLDAPDIGRVSARALGLDLDKLNARLFVDARQAFPGEAVQLDRADPHNPTVRITHQGRQAILPVNKNILHLDDRQILWKASSSTFPIPTRSIYPCKQFN